MLVLKLLETVNARTAHKDKQLTILIPTVFSHKINASVTTRSKETGTTAINALLVRQVLNQTLKEIHAFRLLELDQTVVATKESMPTTNVKIAQMASSLMLLEPPARILIKIPEIATLATKSEDHGRTAIIATLVKLELLPIKQPKPVEHKQ